MRPQVPGQGSPTLGSMGDPETVYAWEDGERVAYVNVFGRLTRLVLDDPNGGEDGLAGVREPKTSGPGEGSASLEAELD